MTTRSTTKHFLNVAYKDRDLAKRLGAKWDPSVRRWYCPCLLYTSPSPRDRQKSRMPSSA